MAATLAGVLFTGGAAGAATIGIGNPVVPGMTDTCPACTYIIGQPFNVGGFQLTDYSFYAMNSGDITPLLFTRTDSPAQSTFTLVGIGAARTVTTSNPLGEAFNFNFALASGTDLTTTNSYFGFENNGAPLVAFNYTGSALNGGTFLIGPNLVLGESRTIANDGFQFNTLNALNDRTYSVAITATGGIPEPATWAMMVVGFGGAGALLRNRRRAAAGLAA